MAGFYRRGSSNNSSYTKDNLRAQPYLYKKPKKQSFRTLFFVCSKHSSLKLLRACSLWIFPRNWIFLQNHLNSFMWGLGRACILKGADSVIILTHYSQLLVPYRRPQVLSTPSVQPLCPPPLNENSRYCKDDFSISEFNPFWWIQLGYITGFIYSTWKDAIFNP